MTPDPVPGWLERLDRGRSVRATSPSGARVLVDHVVPVLFVEHVASTTAARTPTGSLLAGETSVVLVPDRSAGRDRAAEHRRLVERLAGGLSERFGHCLLVEVWLGPPSVGPTFRIAPDKGEPAAAVAVSAVRQLGRVVVGDRRATVTREAPGALRPPGGGPAVLRAPGHRPWSVLHVEVGRCFADPETERIDAALWRRLRRLLVLALRRISYDFTRNETRWTPPHVHALGRRTLPALARKVDAALASVQREVDVLVAVTPTDALRMRRQFLRAKRDKAPEFRYPPLAFDPDEARRTLAAIPVEHVDDPTLAHIFRGKRRELDLQLSLIEHRGRPPFLGLSAALYGNVPAAEAAAAEALLARLPVGRKRAATATDAAGFAVRATELVAGFDGADVPNPVVRPGLTSLMVSHGQLHVGAGMTFPKDRVEALLAHEVGTHIVTWVNGRAQPLELLAVGLPGYDECQEGLAVLAEHLVGGLDRARLRTLAARVVAARCVQDGADFVETFRRVRDLGFKDEPAFTVTMRVHRGGGLLKDAVYLRGLRAVVDAVAGGLRLPSLLLGKLALDHVVLVEELVRREILRPPRVVPPYLAADDAQARLAALRGAAPALEALVNA